VHLCEYTFFEIIKFVFFLAEKILKIKLETHSRWQSLRMGL
jgi:hypothetical protein